MQEVTEEAPLGGSGVTRVGMMGKSAVRVTDGKRAPGLLASVDEDLRKLPAREGQILRLLFGVGEVPHSRDEAGRRLGMSPDWLRSLERRALRNLRSAAISDETPTEVGARPHKPGA